MTILKGLPSGVRSFVGAVFGVLASLVLWIIFAAASTFFRGPILGWNELGGPVYKDLTANHLITGIGYFLVATAIVVALRRNSSFALIAGFVFGAMILGCSILAGM